MQQANEYINFGRKNNILQGVNLFPLTYFKHGGRGQSVEMTCYFVVIC